MGCAAELVSGSGVRCEEDALGQIAVPAEAYFGAHSQRAAETFAGAGAPLGSYPALVRSLALVKKAAALANVSAGSLDPQLGAAITEACDDVAAGRLLDDFVVGILVPSDTAFNMNANEVLANRANELLGSARGTYRPVHPLDHVNRSQSTNDVVHTALHVVAVELTERLASALDDLARAFRRQAGAHEESVRMGRTCLQDALPISFAQVFEGYATTVDSCREALLREVDALLDVNLGGTAIGTGFNAPPGYGRQAVATLSDLTGRPWRQAPSLVAATQNVEGLAFLIARARVTALSLSKIAADLRLMASGPRAGLNELQLPALQPGSSIMPGKVNPLACMLVVQTAYRVAGLDATVGLVVAAGELELNPHGSLVGYCLLEAFEALEQAVRCLSDRCVDGLVVRTEACAASVGGSPVLATALVPLLGYDAASRIARSASGNDLSILEAVERSGLVPEQIARTLLDPRRFLAPESENHDRATAPAGPGGEVR